MQISPSGDRMAFVAVVGDQRTMALADLKTNTTLGTVGVGLAKVKAIQWVGEDKVLVTTASTESIPDFGISKTEFYLGQIFDPARRRVTRMLNGAASVFPALMGMPRVVRNNGAPLVLVRAYEFDRQNHMDLYRIDPDNGRPRAFAPLSDKVVDYVLDTQGNPVAKAEYDERTGRWSLQLKQGDDFRETFTTTALLDRPDLMGLGMNGDSVIVWADRPDLTHQGQGVRGLFDVNLATGVWRSLRFEISPQRPLFHPVNGRLVGVTRRDDDGSRYSFVEQGAGELWAAVESGFPGKKPELVSWSDDLRQAVVYTSGDGDSGAYHLVDLDDASVSTVGSAYPTITPEMVAPVRLVTYDAADGLEIHGYLTLPPGRADARGLPLVVLAHGGPEWQDESGFDWEAQAMASRGYAVLQANFRGSTGYGLSFLEAGYGEWGRKMQTDLSDGVRYLAGEGVIDPKRVCIVGASYGGYAAMAGPTLDHGVYRCAVAVSGVSDLRRMIAWEAAQGVRKDNETVRYWNRFMGGDGPGDRSLDARSPARLAETADAPILLIHGRDDTVVPIEQSRVMAAALRRAGKPVELIELSGEDHHMSREETRTQMLTETVRFLEANNPPGAPSN
ncbi:S9 family peptidase [Brevundimonas goettingensis]|uniref:S9 family peptidase n=1 Tax=Brevundimonas goettingensis TaxID=2774190 RepID=A0A975C3W4_9CAUL|nr:S9 family peptidase [Brevundimonas goettingensis]